MRLPPRMQFLVVLSLCAVLALWIRISIPSVDTSIKVDGVYLGMTRAELENRPDIEAHRWTEVSYDADDRVARVFVPYEEKARRARS